MFNNKTFRGSRIEKLRKVSPFQVDVCKRNGVFSVESIPENNVYGPYEWVIVIPRKS